MGAIALSASERPGSGITSSGSTSMRVPSPSHSAQAPNGELNEKLRGSSSSKLSPSSMHARCSLKVDCRCGSSGSRSTRSITTTPPPSRNAVSTVSVRRRLPDFLATSRSTTTEIECLTCLRSLGTSSKAYVVPSTSTLAKPCVCSERNKSTNSPLRSRTTGASTWKRVPSGICRIWSTICCGVWRDTGLPHFGQCGSPIRAYNRRR